MSALFYKPGDIKKLVRHIEKLLNSNELRKSLAQNARMEFDQLTTFDQMVDQYEQLFQEAWASARPRSC